MTKDELEDQILELQREYVKAKPKPAHRDSYYADGCAWAHFDSCSFGCSKCMCFLMQECGVYGRDYHEGRYARMNDLHKYRNYLKDFLAGKIPMQYAIYTRDANKNVVTQTYATEKEADKAMHEYIKGITKKPKIR